MMLYIAGLVILYILTFVIPVDIFSVTFLLLFIKTFLYYIKCIYTLNAFSHILSYLYINLLTLDSYDKGYTLLQPKVIFHDFSQTVLFKHLF